MIKLNPWAIEVVFRERERIRLNIIEENTGEIRQITLSADDLANILTVGLTRNEIIANLIRDGSEYIPQIEAIIGKVPDWHYE
jgi:uncharacterized protein with PhoU and TrkA domain